MQRDSTPLPGSLPLPRHRSFSSTITARYQLRLACNRVDCLERKKEERKSQRPGKRVEPVRRRRDETHRSNSSSSPSDSSFQNFLPPSLSTPTSVHPPSLPSPIPTQPTPSLARSPSQLHRTSTANNNIRSDERGLDE